MDLRRALANAAVAAVLMPVILAAAPAGYAVPGTEGGAEAAPSPTATPTASGTASPGGGAAPGEPPPSPPPPSSPSPSLSPSRTLSPSPSPSLSLSPSPSPSPSDGGTAGPAATASPSPTATTQPTPPTDGTATPGAPPSGTADPDSPNGVCDVAAFDVRIEGLPATVPAGSTTGPFTVVLDNSAGTDAARVQFGLSVAFRDGLQDRDWLAAGRYVTVRYYDREAGTWRNALDGGGLYTYTPLEAGKTYEMRLRLVLAPDTPPGAAGALAFSTRWNFGGPPGSSACVYDNEWYRFEITASGTAPATAQVRPQGGRPPVALRTGSVEAAPDEATFARGALARTGAGPDLTLLIGASATALALGAGALLLAVRRRG